MPTRRCVQIWALTFCVAVAQTGYAQSAQDERNSSSAAKAPSPNTTETSGDGEDFGSVMRRRAEIIRLHRPLGIATWAAMTATVILGGIQYHNLYGFFKGQGDNPCVRGTAIFGQGQCTGTPLPHLASAALTSALYTATFALSLQMPDPGGLDEGDSPYARRLRLHKTLRWVHFGGMLAQLALGIVVSNGTAFGLDRANDYGTLQALATVHAGLGLATYGALTWAAALFAF